MRTGSCRRGLRTRAAGAAGLLVMGDGSARRTEKAPGWLDERAAGFDAAASAALAAGDPALLARGAICELGAQLLAAGAPAWRAASRLLAGRLAGRSHLRRRPVRCRLPGGDLVTPGCRD